MTFSEAEERHHQLAEEIRRHDHAYYVLAQPTLTDPEYDRLYQELVDLETNYSQLVTPESPTQRVGGQPVGGFQRVRHLVPMLSLDKIEASKFPTEKEEPDLAVRNRLQDQNTLVGLKNFDKTIQKQLKKGVIDYVMEPKVDGVSIAIHYKNGKLALGVTRGDGIFGDDITANVRTIRGIPLVLKLRKPPPLIEVRGEAYISKTEFEELNAKQAAAGEQSFPNARNATAGTLKQLDPRLVSQRPISVVFYAVGACEGIHFSTHAEVLESLKEFGLPTQSFWWLCEGIDRVLECYSKEVVCGYDENQDLRSKVPYDIDGIVLKVNSIDDWKRIPTKAKAPGYAIVHKPVPWITPAETILKAITVQVGRTGVLTPVAELEPIFVQGSTISRATLHNEDEIRRKDIRIGDTVVIRKAGMVIPEVRGVVLSKRPANTKAFDLFAHIGGRCPACHGPIAKEKILGSEKEEVAWRCQNIAGCPAQKTRRIEYFAQRKALDIESLGGIIAEKLVERKLAEEPLDLFKLRLDQLANLNLGTEEEPRLFGHKNATKLLAALERARTLPLGRWLYAFGIPDIGEITAHYISQLHRDLEDVAGSDVLRAIIQTGDNRSETKSVNKRLEPEFQSSLAALRAAIDRRARSSDQLTKQVYSERKVLEAERESTRLAAEPIAAEIEKYKAQSVKPPKGLRPKLTELKHRLERLEERACRAGVHECIGPVVAESVTRFFASERGKLILEGLRRLGISPSGALAVQASGGEPARSQPLLGKTFVLTGTLASMDRESAAEEIRKRGGTLTSSVSGKTNFLVVGENAGAAKSEQARSLGVKQLTEEEFLLMLGLQPRARSDVQQNLL